MKTMPLLFVFVLVALPGCFLGPRLPPVAEPPHVPPGAEVLVFPERFIETMASAWVQRERDALLPSHRSDLGVVADDVLAHRIVTGMSTQEVVWAATCHPTREERQGPPGGRTYLWETGGVWVPTRFFVRFDETGHVVSAGRY